MELLGKNFPDQRQERRLDIDLSYEGVERRRPVTIRDADGSVVIRPCKDAYRFDDERFVSGLVPFDAVAA